MLTSRIINYVEFKSTFVLKPKDIALLEKLDIEFLRVNFFLKSGLKKKTAKLINTNLG